MKRKLEIIDEIPDRVQMTKSDLIERIESDPIGTLISYDIDEDLIIDLLEYIPVNIFCQVYSPSENLIKKLLEIEYLVEEDLCQLSMTSISSLSKEFLDEKIEFLNFDRIILNYSAGRENFFLENNPQDYIEMEQLHGPYFWRILSSNKLPKETILKYLDKWIWDLLIVNNSFSDFTEEEYQSITPYLPVVETEVEDVQKSFDDSEFEDIINNIIQKYGDGDQN